MKLAKLKVYLSQTRQSVEEVCARVATYSDDADEPLPYDVLDAPPDIAADSPLRDTLRMLRSLAFEASLCNDHATLALVSVDALGTVQTLVYDQW